MRVHSRFSSNPSSPKNPSFSALACAFSLALASCLGACASPGPRNPGDASAANSTTGTPATQLARQVNQWHDDARVTDAVPFLFDEAKTHEFARVFIARACPEEATGASAAISTECNRRFGAAVAELLHERYFAADADAIQTHCRAEPLTCEDARTFEVLFRTEHNAGIERSRQDKLQSIDQWRLGRIDEDALQRELHFKFELSNGTLMTHLPPSRTPAGTSSSSNGGSSNSSSGG